MSGDNMRLSSPSNALLESSSGQLDQAYSKLSHKLKQSHSSFSIMENFECTVRQYPVRKVESMNELSESTSCILEYS